MYVRGGGGVNHISGEGLNLMQFVYFCVLGDYLGGGVNLGIRGGGGGGQEIAGINTG